MHTTWLLAIPVAYLVGSIPFGLLIGRLKGIDIRSAGSGNIGATNVGRLLGFRYFVVCFLLDMAKGLVPTLTFGVLTDLAGTHDMPASSAWIWLAVMASTVLGHMFSPFLGFKGGKGVATGLGALLAVYPALTIPGALAGALFAVTLALWRYVSLSSCLAAVTLPVFVWHLFALLQSRAEEIASDAGETAPIINQWPFFFTSIALAALVLWKHRTNIARIAAGTEPKVGARRNA